MTRIPLLSGDATPDDISAALVLIRAKGFRAAVERYSNGVAMSALYLAGWQPPGLGTPYKPALRAFITQEESRA